MIIGVVKEIKSGENRVGLTPEGAKTLVNNGIKVLAQKGAGIGSGFSDSEYLSAGAEVLELDDVWNKAGLIVKVKEPLPSEFSHMREGQIIFTYLHLAAENDLTLEMIKRKVTGIAYETIEINGKTPLLAPMSQVAGRMSIQVGMHYLEKTNGGFGKLLAGVSGVDPAIVTIIGSGVAGSNAAYIAHGVGANVAVVGIDKSQLEALEKKHHGLKGMLSPSKEEIAKRVAESDLVVGTVAVPGFSAPKIVTREMIKKMRPGSVVVDISIDQGGSFETSRPTSHSNPIFVEEGITHYCVTNMPGAVPNTSTKALTNATLPYVLKIAKEGLKNACKEPGIAKGVNTHDGFVTNKGVAESLGLNYAELKL